MTQWDAKARAAQIPNRLQARVDAWTTLPVRHPHRIHALFTELYVCTSQHWLRRLDTAEQNDFAYAVMTDFWALFERHLPGGIDAPITQIAPHWRNYHRVARRVTFRAPTSVHLVLISLGVRAHIHRDLGQAVLAAERKLDLTPEQAEAARATLFDGVSEAAFFDATLAFIDRQQARQRGWRRRVLAVYRTLFLLLRPIWWREMRRWRISGYGKAVAAADRGKARRAA